MDHGGECMNLLLNLFSSFIAFLSKLLSRILRLEGKRRRPVEVAEGEENFAKVSFEMAAQD